MISLIGAILIFPNERKDGTSWKQIHRMSPYGGRQDEAEEEDRNWIHRRFIRLKSQRIPSHTFPCWRYAVPPPHSRRSCSCRPDLWFSVQTAPPPVQQEKDGIAQVTSVTSGLEVDKVTSHVHVLTARVEGTGWQLVVCVKVTRVTRVCDFRQQRNFSDLQSVHALERKVRAFDSMQL